MPVYAIDIKEYAGVNLTDYQVKIVLENIGFTDWANLTANSIYFLDSAGNPLYFWIERLDTVNKRSTIWVKIPFIPANSIVRIYMYYGGSNPYSSYNDPYKTFLFFEDFENGRDPNWVDGSLTPGQYEYATPSLWTGSYRLHYKTGRSQGAFYNMWWKGRTFDNFRFIAYLRADYSDDDSAILFRATGEENCATAGCEPIGYRMHLPQASYQFFVLKVQKPDGTRINLATLSASPTTDIVRYEILAYGSKIKIIIERPPYSYLGTINVTDATFLSGYIGIGAPGWNSNRNPSFDTFAVANYIDPEPTVITGIPIVLSDVVEYSQQLAILSDTIVYIPPSAPNILSDTVANIPPSAPITLSDTVINIPPSAPITLSDTILNLPPTAPIVLSDVVEYTSPLMIPLSDLTVNIPPAPYIPPPTPTCLEFQDILSQEGYSWDKAIASLLCGLEAVLTELGNEISRSARTIGLVFIGVGFGYALMRVGEKIIMLILRGLRKSYEKKR